MRALRGHFTLLIAAVSAASPACAENVDSATEVLEPEQDDKPDPDPGGLDIQYPRPRFLAMATIGSGNEYRDRLLSDRTVASFSGGIAYLGFSASVAQNWEVSTGEASHELLAGYSYKLPLVDVHAGFVVCGNRRMVGGCPDGVRLTLTTNSIPDTTIEASFDQPLSSDRRSFAAAITRDLWTTAETSGAVRVGWTRTDYGGSIHLDGFSVRAIVARRLSERLELDFAAGAIWTSGMAQSPAMRDGVFGSTSFVWRY